MNRLIADAKGDDGGIIHRYLHDMATMRPRTAHYRTANLIVEGI